VFGSLILLLNEQLYLSLKPHFAYDPVTLAVYTTFFFLCQHPDSLAAWATDGIMIPVASNVQEESMPQITVDLTWQEWEALTSVAQSEEIPREEVVRRALDGYLAEERMRLVQEEDSTVTATRDHLVGPDEVMNLDL
jgi:hypothetical protein